ncbi:thioredoxin [Janthinobacterium sp. OK676]|uniref:thioredoxin n=1 Tax=unclassified Janthinobacterium TaxID=2610881 RepID=UPI0008832A04|nr:MULTISPECIES: thioredoxin [unclassified Janthinobacterium]PKB13804.1 thioredoxin [Janthinobacterium sp. 64]SDN22152.1 thioredoxin [Janthinobacterium sp. OK676]
MTSTILNTTDASFETDVLKVPGLVLVDFWADWCGPCKALAPILADLADEYPEVRVVKVNADENRQVGEQLAIRGLPSLLLFSNGVECARLLGTQSKTRLAALLDEKLEA